MKRVVVLGAAGFLGSHLCDYLLNRGDAVVGVDDLSTGSLENIVHLKDNPRFSFIPGDICSEIAVTGTVDAVLNFASPASPPRYQAIPIQTLRTGSIGTENALRLAMEKNARFVMASTSEVYGDPTVSPQPESYWGNVNPIGERSCYDEAKRYAEAICMAYKREHDIDLGIVRIFNTYGPRLDPKDGRVVSNLVTQAILGQDLTIYGDGSQTRSFCYVSDEVRGIISLMDTSHNGPINIGNPNEFTMNELAELVIELTGTKSNIRYRPLPTDDPLRRCPDISLASELLDWRPEIQLREGLAMTIQWFRDEAITD
jgi:nucleoside-diphosphate-sugar epimerase